MEQGKSVMQSRLRGPTGCMPWRSKPPGYAPGWLTPAPPLPSVFFLPASRSGSSWRFAFPQLSLAPFGALTRWLPLLGLASCSCFAPSCSSSPCASRHLLWGWAGDPLPALPISTPGPLEGTSLGNPSPTPLPSPLAPANCAAHLAQAPPR